MVETLVVEICMLSGDVIVLRDDDADQFNRNFAAAQTEWVNYKHGAAVCMLNLRNVELVRTRKLVELRRRAVTTGDYELMDTKNLRRSRKKLEHDIERMLEDWQQETGITIATVDVSSVEVTSMHDDRPRYAYRVRTTLIV